jgi:hypothetical protein
MTSALLVLPAGASPALAPGRSTTTSCLTDGGSLPKASDVPGATALTSSSLQITTTQVILTFVPNGAWQTRSSNLSQSAPVILEDIVEEPDSVQIDAVVFFDGFVDGRPSWSAIVSKPTASTFPLRGRVVASAQRIQIFYPIASWVKAGVTTPFTWNATVSFSNSKFNKNFEQTCFVDAPPGR